MLGSKFPREGHFQSNVVSPRHLSKVDKVLRKEENGKRKLLPDIVKISLTDMSSLDKMSASNQKAYI